MPRPKKVSGGIFVSVRVPNAVAEKLAEQHHIAADDKLGLGIVIEGKLMEILKEDA